MARKTEYASETVDLLEQGVIPCRTSLREQRPFVVAFVSVHPAAAKEASVQKRSVLNHSSVLNRAVLYPLHR